LYIIETIALIPNKFCTNKDHQMLFMAGPNMHTANQRSHNAAILKKSINHHNYICNALTNLKFDMVTQIVPLNHTGSN